MTLSPLTLPELSKALPQAATKRGRPGLSKRYTPVSTLDVARELYADGWQAVQVDAVKPRRKALAPYAKHLVRFSHREDTLGIGTVPQLLLYNSADGESALRGLVGTWRFVCANGMIDGTTDSIVRTQHTGDVDAASFAGALLDEVEPLIDRMIRFHDARPNPVDVERFARTVAGKLWPELLEEPRASDLDDASFALVRPRRWADMARDGWTIANIVQENAMRGGIPLGDGEGRRRVTRAVRGVDSDVAINQTVWAVAGAELLGEVIR